MVFIEYLFTLATSYTLKVVLYSLTLILAYVLLRDKRSPSLPPGPRPWPFVGNHFDIRGDPTQALLRLKRQYGDIITLYIGSRPTVYLLSYNAIQEALVKHSYAFSGRPSHYLFLQLRGRKGIASSIGVVHNDQKSFAIKVLRDFGMGRSGMEARIQNEAGHLVEALLQKGRTPFDPHHLIQCTIVNVVHGVVFGHRNDYEDASFKQQLGRAKFIFRVCAPTNVLQKMPFVKHLPGDLFHYEQVKQTVKEYSMHYKNKINAERKTYTKGVVRHFVDAYVAQMEKADDNVPSNYNDEQLLGSVVDIMDGSSDSMKAMFLWSIALLLHYPHIMTRVTAEIDDVIGHERMPSNHDRADMSYTEAFLLEVLRYKIIVPVVAHATVERVQLREFDIPRDTDVMVALGPSLHDPDVWQNPEQFKPERFLDSNGRFVNSTYITNFSIGARSCPAEALARMQIFVLFVAMLQRVTISLPPGDPLPDLSSIIGLTVNPPAFNCIMKQRHM